MEVISQFRFVFQDWLTRKLALAIILLLLRERVNQRKKITHFETQYNSMSVTYYSK